MNSLISTNELFITISWLLLMLFIGDFVCIRYSKLKQNFQLFVFTYLIIGSVILCVIRSISTIGGLLQ